MTLHNNNRHSTRCVYVGFVSMVYIEVSSQLEYLVFSYWMKQLRVFFFYEGDSDKCADSFVNPIPHLYMTYTNRGYYTRREDNMVGNLYSFFMNLTCVFRKTIS